jgi:hypothetical protein
VPLLVSNIHDIILVHTQYVLVCTGLYFSSFPVPVCTRYVPVRTGSEPVHPVPVMRLTIPDAGPWASLQSVTSTELQPASAIAVCCPGSARAKPRRINQNVNIEAQNVNISICF